MNKFRQTISLLTGFGLIGLIVWGLYKLFEVLWEGFKSVDSSLGAGIIAAAATIVVSVLSILISKRIENKQAILSAHRNKVAPLYEDFIEFIFMMMFAEKLGKEKLTEIETMEKLAKFTQEIIVWGSDGVISAFYNFRNKSIKAINNESVSVFLEVEDLLLAIRKDLGHSNKGLSRGKILGLFINDIHEFIPMLKK